MFKETILCVRFVRRLNHTVFREDAIKMPKHMRRWDSNPVSVKVLDSRDSDLIHSATEPSVIPGKY